MMKHDAGKGEGGWHLDHDHDFKLEGELIEYA